MTDNGNVIFLDIDGAFGGWGGIGASSGKDQQPDRQGFGGQACGCRDPYIEADMILSQKTKL